MIDPAHSLAFSIQVNPGVYAVLLGSGVSRTVKIHTPWETTLGLIRRLAAIYEETTGADLEHWYRDKFGMQADYFELLDASAETQIESQQLFRRSIETSDQEFMDGEKQCMQGLKALGEFIPELRLWR